MMQLFKTIKINNVLKLQVRYKHPKHHWSELQRENKPKHKALEHFDDFYGSIYGKIWPDMRKSLLQEEHKYIALVNNFSETSRIRETLQALGAADLKRIYEVQVDIQSSKKKAVEKAKLLEESSNEDKVELEKILAEREEKLRLEEEKKREEQMTNPKYGEVKTEEDKPRPLLSPVSMSSISQSEECIDNTRIVRGASKVSAGSLGEFVPATKIKGLDTDYALTSDHFGSFEKGADFKVVMEEEPPIEFPKHLICYTFEPGSEETFPAPRKGEAGVFDYYLMDGASIFPILALDLKEGDKVLDVCAAPGGKALAALQTLMPGVLIANDRVPSRVNRLRNVFKQFFADMGQWKGRISLTQHDARHIQDKDYFDKILVDVPCTTDRHTLHADENNIFNPARIKERLGLPELQSSILTHALKLVKVGGTVVYSTCTLSPVQNEGVVQLSLKQAWEDESRVFMVKDFTKVLKPFYILYKFPNSGLKYGHVITPTLQNNWGPLYFCKIVRIQ